ncbi:MAG: hypothetical protein AAB375_00920 [Patescibacteria group bacterium]
MDEESEKPVRFQVLMSGHHGGAPGLRAAMAGWFIGNINVFLQLKPDMDSFQQKMFLDVIQQWGRALPFSLQSTEQPRIVMPEEAEAIRSLFEKALTTATVVRIFRSVMPHQAENRERDEAIISDMRAFCTEKSGEIRQLSRIGVFEVEQWVFEMLCWHLKQLLPVILGDTLMKRFEKAFNQQMRELLQMAQLAAASPQ